MERGTPLSPPALGDVMAVYVVIRAEVPPIRLFLFLASSAPSAAVFNLVFHMDTPAGEYDLRVQLSEVYVSDWLSSILSSPHHAQRKQHIVLNDAGVHLFDGRLIFSRGGNGSWLSATRVPPSALHGGMTAVYSALPAPPPPSSVEGVVPFPLCGF